MPNTPADFPTMPSDQGQPLARQNAVRKISLYGIPATCLLLALSACTSPPAVVAPAQALVYTCADGRAVKAVYPDTETAMLTLDGQTLKLQVAVSADGARYVDQHWQWWTKGMHQAWLAPLKAGETIASAAGVACHAP